MNSVLQLISLLLGDKKPSEESFFKRAANTQRLLEELSELKGEGPAVEAAARFLGATRIDEIAVAKASKHAGALFSYALSLLAEAGYVLEAP